MGADADHDPGRDGETIRTLLYPDDKNLLARQRFWRFEEPRGDLAEWVLDQHRWRGDETVLDVGCGNGKYLRALAPRVAHGIAVGFDLSHGVLAALDPTTPRAQADILHLPLADASVDVTIAAHVLQHVPDPAVAAEELRRVVRDDGIVLVVANAGRSLTEVQSLVHTSVHAVTGVAPLPPALPTIVAETALELLATVFGDVVEDRRDGTVVLTDPSVLVDYVDSMRGGWVTRVSDGQWRELLSIVERTAVDAIREHGAYRTAASNSLFRCR